jgi:carboxymethylenebutenolidase
MKLLRFLRKMLLGILAAVLLVVLVIAGIIAFDHFFPAQRVTDFTNVTYPGSDGTTLHAFLAVPAGDGPFPAVLMIHEFYGLNGGIVKKAQRLADEGFIVLAPDAYRGRTTALVPRAIWLTVTTPRPQIAADIDAAYQYLVQIDSAAADRVGVVGFCFGGTQALQLGIRNPELAANVIFYGSGLVTDPDALGELGSSGPVLGIFGEQDNSIPLEEVLAFDQAMNQRQIENTVTVYPGVGHAFVQDDLLDQDGAARQAWLQMLQFLQETLANRGG